MGLTAVPRIGGSNGIHAGQAMSHEESRIEEVFLRAREIQPAQERSAYLNRACEGDEPLRLRVERMLAAQPQLGSFLDRDAAGMVLTIDQQLPE